MNTNEFNMSNIKIVAGGGGLRHSSHHQHAHILQWKNQLNKHYIMIVKPKVHKGN